MTSPNKPFGVARIRPGAVVGTDAGGLMVTDDHTYAVYYNEAGKLVCTRKGCELFVRQQDLEWITRIDKSVNS